MQIVITGGSGFLGQRLAKALLASTYPFDQLVIADIIMPTSPVNDIRVTCLQIDLSDERAARALITTETDVVFHLAAVVSSHAEKDFDLGWRVNLDITRYLLEACRHTKRAIRFIFSSSLAVFGGDLPQVVSDNTVVTPQSSYGIQKAMGELIVNDYARKNFVDGIALRLPTICVRPGRPNQAASSFVSSIIREPLRGEEAVCPVSPDLALFLSSPDTVIRNLIHGATVKSEVLKGWRTINLPGITVTIKQMLDSLRAITSEQVSARVKFKPDDAISRIVSSWPGRIDNSRALRLGFFVDDDFNKFIHQHITESNHPSD